MIDPFEGQADLSLKVFKAVVEPKQRFEEDALRMMRAIRLGAQLHFSVEEKTLQAMQVCAPLIKKVSWERIRAELLKILASDHPR